MKVLKITSIVVVAIIALFLIVPLFVQKDYKVARSIDIAAEKEELMQYMANFNHFNAWSPWSEMDPEMKVTISGIDGEAGSIYYWKGNDDVGEGKMELMNINANEIHIKLNFIAPFESESPTVYHFKDLEDGTQVTWEMEGSMDYPWNIFMLFMDMEEAIGKDFEKGLSKLKNEFSKS